MEHFWEDIHGNFNSRDLFKEALRLYSPQDAARFDIIGTWYGKSVAYMGVEILNSANPGIKLDVFEDFVPTEEQRDRWPAEALKMRDGFAQTIDPLARAGLELGVTEVLPTEGASHVPDTYYDMVYIDWALENANTYLELLRNWWPKVKPGGMMTGCGYFTNGPIRVALNAFLSGIGYKFRSRNKEENTWELRKRLR